MQLKLAKWYLSQDKLPYWYLLLADCCTIVLAGVCAFFINHGPHFHQIPTLILTLLAYLPFYIAGILIFRTYRDAVRHIEIKRITQSRRCNNHWSNISDITPHLLHSDLWGSTIRIRDLAFQSALAFVLMTGLRMIVKITYEDYIRRK